MRCQKPPITASPKCDEAVTDSRLLQQGITTIRKEYSFGIIGYKIVSQTPKYLLIQHRYNREWGFPKGHYEKHENRNGSDTAKREFREETGLEFTMTDPNGQNGNVISVDWDHPFVSHYDFTRGHGDRRRLHKKWTVLFAAEISEFAKPRIDRPQEIGDIKWMTKHQFDRKNKHREYKEILAKLDATLLNIIRLTGKV